MHTSLTPVFPLSLTLTNIQCIYYSLYLSLSLSLLHITLFLKQMHKSLTGHFPLSLSLSLICCVFTTLSTSLSLTHKPLSQTDAQITDCCLPSLSFSTINIVISALIHFMWRRLSPTLSFISGTSAINLTSVLKYNLMCLISLHLTYLIWYKRIGIT